jgi:hypothetical protein
LINIDGFDIKYATHTLNIGQIHTSYLSKKSAHTLSERQNRAEKIIETYETQTPDMTQNIDMSTPNII